METRRTLRTTLLDGLVAGLLGYVGVLVTVSVFDVVRGHAVVYTAERIGAVLFFGGASASTLTEPLAPVLAWNGVHLLVSLAVGVLGASMVFGSERFTGFWFVGLMALIAIGVWALTGLGGMGDQLAGVLDWPVVIVGTLVWLGAMTAWLWRTHSDAPDRIAADLRADR